MKSTKSVMGGAVQTMFAIGLAGFAMPFGSVNVAANGTATESVHITADIPEVCDIAAFTPAIFEIPVANGLPTNVTLTSDTVINCNTPTSIRIQSAFGGMMIDFSVSGGTELPDTNYISAFDYTAEVSGDSEPIVTFDSRTETTFGALEMSSHSALDPADVKPDTPLSLSITPKVNEIPANKILQAGLYQDLVTVEIIPQ